MTAFLTGNQMTMEHKPLKIEDVNHKLDCFGFIVIHFAPPPGKVREEDFETIYQVQRDQRIILVKLVDFTRIRFGNIGSILTVPATGFEAHVWRREWLRKYPKITDDTEMAIYCYIKRL